MPTTLERPDLREAPVEDTDVKIEPRPDELLRRPLEAPAREMLAPKKPVRWMRWMLAVAALVAGAVIAGLAFVAIGDDGGESVTDSQALPWSETGTYVESAQVYTRALAEAPTVAALPWSETGTYVESALAEAALHPQPVSVSFIPGAGSASVQPVGRTFITGDGAEAIEPISVSFIPGNRYIGDGPIDAPEPISVTFIPGNGSQAPDPVDVIFVSGNGSGHPEPVNVTFIPGGG